MLHNVFQNILSFVKITTSKKTAQTVKKINPRQKSKYVLYFHMYLFSKKLFILFMFVVRYMVVMSKTGWNMDETYIYIYKLRA
jgi:hypothetical protein